VIAAIGDLVEDIVVHLGGPIAVASDTESVVLRRRGGSAANVCAAAAFVDHRPTRFIGQVGDDPAGEMLTGMMTGLGVDLAVRRRGRTGTIVVLVDQHGERTMLPDPATSKDLSDPDPAWLDGVGVLHIPLYSLLRSPMDQAVATTAEWARCRGIPVSIDASSAALIQRAGVDRMVERLAGLGPHVVLANELEARTLGDRGLDRIGAPLVVIKRGPDPAEVRHGGRADTVHALDIGPVADTTAAGDSFAAGFLGGLADGADPVECCRHGHRVAAAVLGAALRP
jgi:sugar/nucleoside kinase (ribokinase family)